MMMYNMINYDDSDKFDVQLKNIKYVVVQVVY